MPFNEGTIKALSDAGGLLVALLLAFVLLWLMLRTLIPLAIEKFTAAIAQQRAEHLEAEKAARAEHLEAQRQARAECNSGTQQALNIVADKMDGIAKSFLIALQEQSRGEQQALTSHRQQEEEFLQQIRDMMAKMENMLNRLDQRLVDLLAKRE